MHAVWQKNDTPLYKSWLKFQARLRRRFWPSATCATTTPAGTALRVGPFPTGTTSARALRDSTARTATPSSTLATGTPAPTEPPVRSWKRGGSPVSVQKATQALGMFAQGPLADMDFALLFTSRKAGQHVLLVQGGQGLGQVTFSFLETSVHVQPLWNLWASKFQRSF